MSTTSTANGRSKPRGTKATTAAAKRTTPAEPTPERRDDVTLDLDTLEREDRKEPFRFLHHGHVYEIMDPQELDWQDMLRAFGDPIFFMEKAMSPEDAKTFFATKTPAWKLKAIQEKYQAHFGMPSLGE